MFLARTVIPCTKCGYCMPCGGGVNIPGVFDLFNYAHLYDDAAGARLKNQIFLPPEQRSGACIECRQCEDFVPAEHRSQRVDAQGERAARSVTVPSS